MIFLENVSKVFGVKSNKVYALNNISLKIGQGEALAILGPSGSGKTTLLEIIGTLLNVSTGNYFFKNKNIVLFKDKELARLRNQSFGFVFQTFNLIPKLTAFQNVALPFVYSSVKKNERKEKINNALELVGMTHKTSSLVNLLSGGEQQRIAIARAIVMKPSIILADEPTGNLDSENGEKIIHLLLDLWKKGHTIIIITHNEQIASKFPRILKILDGQIIYDGTIALENIA